MKNIDGLRQLIIENISESSDADLLMLIYSILFAETSNNSSDTFKLLFRKF